MTDVFHHNSMSRLLMTRLANKWSILIIIALEDGPHRFGVLKSIIAGISQKMLTQSLRELATDGLISRTVFHEMPLRVEYALTDKGRSLLPILQKLRNWIEIQI